jgi:diadenosine tetraphosphatase ApaH/serine/threonine PP2A family protein phosphatase
MNRVAPAVSVSFFGHSHIPSIFTLEPDGILVEAVRGSRRKLFLEPGKRYLVNPGSVGQPRDRNPRASYAIFDSEERTVTFDRVPYDVRTTRRKILKAGLPPILGERLLLGL